ncbi:MAG TPA: hypothetical protein VFZ89_04740 [Solirubrobacteraceae bacterium]
MKLRIPSPAMGVALVALFVALAGTAFAAVNYATNAGAVDGKSAVAHGASRAVAAGRLVATQRSGDAKGTIAARYLDLRGYARGGTSTFGKAFDVVDNATGALTPIGTIPGVGSLTAQCLDQSNRAGVEDPATTVTFSNGSGDAVNLARTVGNDGPVLASLANGTVHTFTIGGSNTFELHLERKGVNYLATGAVRQDGRNTPTASCLIYGFSITVAG